MPRYKGGLIYTTDIVPTRNSSTITYPSGIYTLQDRFEDKLRWENPSCNAVFVGVQANTATNPLFYWNTLGVSNNDFVLILSPDGTSAGAPVTVTGGGVSAWTSNNVLYEANRNMNISWKKITDTTHNSGRASITNDDAGAGCVMLVYRGPAAANVVYSTGTYDQQQHQSTVVVGEMLTKSSNTNGHILMLATRSGNVSSITTNQMFANISNTVHTGQLSTWSAHSLRTFQEGETIIVQGISQYRETGISIVEMFNT